MILLVNDANILIDLLKINLLDHFFKLPCEFHVTDMVLAEVDEENVADLMAHVETSTLHIKGFDFEELTKIQTYQIENRGLSVPDCSCLFLARALSGRLLTGDASLRRQAQKKQIQVHGILWIFDQLVAHNFLTQEQAYEKLTQLTALNDRLPKAECEKRLDNWLQG